MNGHTHMIGGMLAGAVLAPIVGQIGTHLLPFVAAAALAAPLPDIDHPGSMYGRFVPLPGVAKVFGRIEPYVRGPFGNGERSFGHVGRRVPFGVLWHRGPTHSVAMALVFGTVGYLAASRVVPALALCLGVGILTGYLSHLALDELNVSGEHFLWPLNRRELRLRWPSFRVGSGWETVLALGMLVLAFWRLEPHVATLAVRSLVR